MRYLGKSERQKIEGWLAGLGEGEMGSYGSRGIVFWSGKLEKF